MDYFLKTNMFKLFAFTALLASCLTVVAAPVCDTLIVTGPTDDAPDSWLTDGKLDGVAIKFAQRLAEKAGVTTVITKHYPTWTDTIAAVNDGEADLIVSAIFSDDRNRYWNFVVPQYGESPVVIVTKKSKKFPLLRLDDLLNKKGAKVKDQAFGSSLLHQFLEDKAKPTSIDSVDQMMNGLATDQFDYGIAYKFGLDRYLMVGGLFQEYAYLTTYPYFGDLHFAFSKQSHCGQKLMPRFEAELKKALNENKFYSMRQEYENTFFESHTSKMSRIAREKNRK
ncbi:MAG: hypothetical protein CK528_15930 [Alcaligenaceae bacterium]|nr:MAG: hypothetical protein CK528_15930 [Alcaligenaceae bacterium]